VSTPPSSDDPRPGADRPLPEDAPTTPHRPAPPQPWGQQPPYGQPGAQPGGWPPPGGAWGQPQPAWAPPAPAGRRDRTRTLLIAALVVIALAVAGATALLVYVLSSTVLDRAAVEAAVAQQFEEREGVALDLACDERMIVRPGADYECEGTTADGEDVEILITVTDGEGAYTWAED
jgi:hypothetical protein